MTYSSRKGTRSWSPNRSSKPSGAGIPARAPMKASSLLLQRLLQSCFSASPVSSFSVPRLSGRESEEFVDLALRSGLFSVAYAQMRSCGVESVSREARDRLKEQVIFNALAAERALQRILALVREFAQQGMEVIPLKGALLSWYLYGDCAMRRAPVDSDVLVRPEDFSFACEIMRRNGYDVSYPGGRGSQQAVCALKDVAPEKGMMVEVHAGLRSASVSCEEGLFWERSRQISVHDTAVRWPSDEDLAWYLMLVAISETEPLETRYFFDLAQLLHSRQGSLRRDQVREWCGRHGGYQPYFALISAARLFRCAAAQDLSAQVPRPSWARRTALGPWLHPQRLWSGTDRGSRLGRLHFMAWYYAASSLAFRRRARDAAGLAGEKWRGRGGNAA